MNAFRITEQILAALAVLAFIAILGIAGWIEGLQ